MIGIDEIYNWSDTDTIVFRIKQDSRQVMKACVPATSSDQNLARRKSSHCTATLDYNAELLHCAATLNFHTDLTLHHC